MAKAGFIDLLQFSYVLPTSVWYDQSPPPAHRSLSSDSKAFTLIELLVVIAIIAILSVVVILVLNPYQLILQSRDSNRVSDMASINSALNIYSAQGGTSLGNVNTVYISIPDPTATSTAGDQCQGLGLPIAPSGTTYFCGASSTYRLTNGTGWIPVNLTTLAGGSLLGQMPIDPLNTSSTGNYYTYATNGTQFVVTAIPESQKYKAQYSSNSPIPGYPEVIAQGSNLTISPLYSPTGLVGYWPFEEGSGSSTADTSGNGNMGTWSGTPIGSNGTYYAGGKVGNYAGDFDGSSTYVNTPNSTMNNALSVGTIAMWIDPNFNNSGLYVLFSRDRHTNGGEILELYDDYNNQFGIVSYVSTVGSINAGVAFSQVWTYVAATYNLNTGAVQIFVNGISVGSGTLPAGSFAPLESAGATTVIGKELDGLGNGRFYNGLIDDVHIYNRALSAAEVQALYNAQK